VAISVIGLLGGGFSAGNDLFIGGFMENFLLSLEMVLPMSSHFFPCCGDSGEIKRTKGEVD
jgi:hypothetical protein